MQLRNPAGNAVAACAAIASLAVGAGAAPAAAATLSVSRACYVNANPRVGAPIHANGAGFTAGDQVELESTGVFGTTTAGSAGTFATTLRGPILSTQFPAQRRFTLSAHDETNGVTSAATTIHVANLAFRTKPGLARPSARVRYSFSGFRGGHAVYGHFIHHGRVITHRFGRAQGPCGMLKTRTRLFPGGHPRFGRYKVQFDDKRRYHARSAPRIDTNISIRRY